MSAIKLDSTIDAISEWLKSFRPALPGKPKEAMYNDTKVWIHSQTKYYAVVSYTESAEKMFSVDLKDLK